MSDRFENLKKIPDEPAARILSANNVKLDTKIEAPVTAPVSVVLQELEDKDALVDFMRLLTVALPARECVWWSCLSARDLVGKEPNALLKAAEAWVFDPSDANRETIRVALENADPDDPASLCGTAAYYGPGNLGVDDLAEQPAPLGALAACAFGQHITAADASGDLLPRLRFLNERGLDIARGGNGSIDAPELESADVAEG